MTEPGLIEVLTFRAGFNTALVVGGTTLLGLAAGVVGVFAMLRKRALVADALSHATLPGIAAAFLVATWLGADGRSLPVLLLGASVSGVLGVLCIQALLRHTRLREDAAIGAVLSVFFGAGIVGLSFIQANRPAGSAGLNALIYGQAATMRPSDVALMAAIAAAGIVATLAMLKEFAVVSFDAAFARTTGWPVSGIDLLMMALVVLVTVAGLQAVGLILVIALLIIPPVAARFWTDRVWVLVVLSGVIGAASGYGGAVVSSMLPRKPAGAVIVLAAGAVFALSMLVAPTRGVIAASLRRLRLRLRIAADHLLEAAYERQGELPARDVAELASLRGWSAPFRWLLLRWLARSGAVASSTRAGIAVSAAGLARGARVSRNHMLWEQYLISYADVAPNHVDWSVDQVEHVLSDPLIARLEQRLRERGVAIPDAPEPSP